MIRGVTVLNGDTSTVSAFALCTLAIIYVSGGLQPMHL